MKPRHVEALVSHWKAREITDMTIRNRLGWIRWVADYVGKAGLIPADNSAFGLLGVHPVGWDILSAPKHTEDFHGVA